MKLNNDCFFFRLTDVALRLFTLYSEGSLLLENEAEIKQKMKESLSFNCAKHDVELSFNLSFKGDDSERPKAKGKAVSEPNIKKQLAANFKQFKKDYNIFEKLPHFAVYRLKVRLYLKT
jgi:hypothetical protein